MPRRVKLRQYDNAYLLECPHRGGICIPTDRGWTWNGDQDRPTIQPSILERTPVYTDESQTWTLEDLRAGRCPAHVNHFFIRDGQVQYLSDCTHKHAGKTYDLRPMWDV